MITLRVAVLLGGLGALASARAQDDVPGDHALGERVSLIRLVAAPAAYDGKIVYVGGYATLAFEAHLLCPFREVASSKDCIWINFDDGPYDTDSDMERYAAAEARWKQYHGKRIYIRGVFEAADTGHLGSTSGGIGRIRDVQAY